MCNNWLKKVHWQANEMPTKLRYKNNSITYCINLRLDEHYPGQKRGKTGYLTAVQIRVNYCNQWNVSISKAITSEKWLTAEGLMVNCMANRPNVQNHTQRGLLATVLQLKHKIYVCGMIWIIIIMYVLYYNNKKLSC